MNIIKVAILVSFTVLCQGCASTEITELEKPSKIQSIVLTEPVKAVSYVGAFNLRQEYGATPGKYISERVDDQGTYFMGTDRPIWFTHEAIQKIPRLYFGGIYVPNNQSMPPSLFYIFETDVHTVGNLDSYIQGRITQSIVNPALNPPNSTVVTNAAGNAIGGVVVHAIIQSGVGSVIKTSPLTGESDVIKIRSALD